ncbi:MAG: signal recognition particle-docking protein FtsY [Gammaproteobacteria bacterium]|nr:signal recognition particle-docking protein FtsY [Gammaproteobacteria bacterium]
MGFFKNLFKSKKEKEKDKKMALGVKKTKAYSFTQLKELIESKRKIDDSFYDELEEILILADMGMDFTLDYTERLKKYVKKNKVSSVDELKEYMMDIFDEMYSGKDKVDLNFSKDGLTVFLFVGVNGSGKTTSIAKVANLLIKEGKKVVLAAGDTFRAGATAQLKVWAERLGIEIACGKEGRDPSSVIYDGIKLAKAQGADVLLCDTAGRLQNKVNLMNELQKIYRVISKEVPNAPHESFLVIDATTGQNGLNQAKVFNEVAPISGVILTKLDGTSKGGIVLSINNALKIPIKLYGYGETMDDLDRFDIESYLYNLFDGILFEGEKE